MEVAVFYSLPELLIFESLLIENGIMFHSRGRYHASVDPITLALGGLTVGVPYSQLNHTMALFDRQGYFDSTRYRSGFFKRNPVKAAITLLFCMLLMVPVPIYGRSCYFRRQAKSEEQLLDVPLPSG
ncbi:hypothetical protein [Parasphingorhabdus sp.]|uniref:hypothetical protein n=1 Tax=Parasphingorhabdus sp. TaxID=2709688 RepID=UPI003592F67A